MTASNGAIFQQSEVTTDDAFSVALAASASHDLPCDQEALEVTHLEAQRVYAVTGCGSRVLYRVVTPTLVSRRIELISRSLLPKTGERPQS